MFFENFILNEFNHEIVFHNKNFSKHDHKKFSFTFFFSFFFFHFFHSFFFFQFFFSRFFVFAIVRFCVAYVRFRFLRSKIMYQTNEFFFSSLMMMRREIEIQNLFVEKLTCNVFAIFVFSMIKTIFENSKNRSTSISKSKSSKLLNCSNTNSFSF